MTSFSDSTLCPPEKIAVVIPCYRVRAFIVDVLSRIGPEVQQIFVVDDCCPEKSGEFVRQHVKDPRVKVIIHAHNQGVGGATITGFQAATEAGAEIIVKVDGDGQIDPNLVPGLVYPIVRGLADYTKGNRFYSHESLVGMPLIRLIGNSGLSFVNKLVSGLLERNGSYQRIFGDPCNGLFAFTD